MLRLSLFIAAAMIAGAPGAALAHGPAKSAPAAAPLSAAAASAARTIDAFHAALGRGDTAAALAMLAEDALIFEAGGAERSRAEYAAEHLAADAAFAQAVPDTRSRRVGRAHGDHAWITTEGRTRGEYKGKPVDRLTTETMVLRRQGGRWVIVHIHWSSRAAPAG